MDEECYAPLVQFRSASYPSATILREEAGLSVLRSKGDRYFVFGCCSAAVATITSILLAVSSFKIWKEITALWMTILVISVMIFLISIWFTGVTYYLSYKSFKCENYNKHLPEELFRRLGIFIREKVRIFKCSKQTGEDSDPSPQEYRTWHSLPSARNVTRVSSSVDPNSRFLQIFEQSQPRMSTPRCVSSSIHPSYSTFQQTSGHVSSLSSLGSMLPAQSDCISGVTQFSEEGPIFSSSFPQTTLRELSQSRRNRGICHISDISSNYLEIPRLSFPRTLAEHRLALSQSIHRFRSNLSMYRMRHSFPPYRPFRQRTQNRCQATTERNFPQLFERQSNAERVLDYTVTCLPSRDEINPPPEPIEIARSTMLQENK